MSASSDSKKKTEPVSSRAAALALLAGAVRDGKAVDTRFQKVAGTLEPRDRAFVRLLVATTLRRLGQIDAVLGHFVTRTPLPPVEDTLRLGVAQILFLDTAPHAAVDTSVELVKRVRQSKMTGLVNAVLRKVVSQGKDLLAEQDTLRLSTPGWLWDGWVKAYGNKTAQQIAAAHLVEAPLDLSLKDVAAIDTWAAPLKATVLSTGSLRCQASGLIQELPGFKDGAWWVQDAAAALPAKVLLNELDNPKGKSVVDLCAAPGGKTLQLASAGCAVTAVDRSDMRLDRLRENLTRIGVQAGIVKADATDWTPKQKFDAVLLDAPCSATGTLRRHPDLGYVKTRKEIRGYPDNQKVLLRKSSEMLMPGGVLVYAVCSLEPGEGADVVEAVIKDGNFSQLKIDPKPLGANAKWIDEAGALRILPSFWSDKGGLDGFYIALLRKT
ncbi:MAG: RsmB/NOP family class I SAM-dependent RNA methyltransferase [Rhodospirillaceae bacterium]|jgi:16S rRNA (cytosine967-C5)-methyltransferase|nr:RsmB/NOP family class I SAM-dependent RNA methyltransferase [Rhodospirillaceae bacterium]